MENAKVFIPLTKGQVAIIDYKDYDEVKKYKWYAVKDHKTYYAYTNAKINGKKTTLKMHRLLTKCQKGLVVDHINHNGLDNTQKNIRVVTNTQNLWNISTNRENRGIRKYGKSEKWSARIKRNSKEIHIGVYKTKEEAKTAFNIALSKYPIKER